LASEIQSLAEPPSFPFVFTAPEAFQLHGIRHTVVLALHGIQINRTPQFEQNISRIPGMIEIIPSSEVTGFRSGVPCGSGV